MLREGMEPCTESPLCARDKMDFRGVRIARGLLNKMPGAFDRLAPRVPHYRG